jgi:CRISPR/Cas system-associated exonuclease Cas4 (RecB family)
MQVSFTQEWEQVEWFDRRTYCRVIFDAVLKVGDDVIVVDHKTGKKRPEEHTDQLRLYALAAFKLWPDVTKVHAQIIYVDQGERLKMDFHKPVEESLQEYWDERADKLRSDDTFVPRPNPGCRWCHFRKSNGGPCIFG